MEYPLSFGAKCLIFFIKLYRYCISPFLGSNCRFYPTCSLYAIDSLKHFKIFKAIWNIIKRISKCHPLHKGGKDTITTTYRDNRAN